MSATSTLSRDQAAEFSDTSPGGPILEASDAYPALSIDKLQERRSGERVSSRMGVCLVPLGAADAVQCTLTDVSEHGLQLTAPIGFGLAVGQRFSLNLISPTVGDKAPHTDVLGQLLARNGEYVTVVRTQLHVGKDSGGAAGDHIGVGLRFDQPLVV